MERCRNEPYPNEAYNPVHRSLQEKTHSIPTTDTNIQLKFSSEITPQIKKKEPHTSRTRKPHKSFTEKRKETPHIKIKIIIREGFHQPSIESTIDKDYISQDLQINFSPENEKLREGRREIHVQ